MQPRLPHMHSGPSRDTIMWPSSAAQNVLPWINSLCWTIPPPIPVHFKKHTHTQRVIQKLQQWKKKKKKLLNLLLKSYYSSCCLNLFVFKIFCISSALWCTLCMQIRFKLILLNTTFTLSYYTQIQHLTFFDAPFQPPNKYKYISLLV